ncbi:uncharacterized protein DS421_11g349820 [Arachis hypogaea]|nr:uncharacterized protein DS421_11g349820 [Arachis hypogaea]
MIRCDEEKQEETTFQWWQMLLWHGCCAVKVTDEILTDADSFFPPPILSTAEIRGMLVLMSLYNSIKVNNNTRGVERMRERERVRWGNTGRGTNTQGKHGKDPRVWNTEDYQRLELDFFSIFVDNLPGDISKRELFNTFKWTGRIIDIYLSRKNKNSQIYLFAFVRYTTKGGALKVVAEMNGIVLRGKRMFVGEAKHRRGAVMQNTKGTGVKVITRYDTGGGQPHIKNVRAAKVKEGRKLSDAPVKDPNSNGWTKKLEVPIASENVVWLQRSIVGGTQSAIDFRWLQKKIHTDWPCVTQVRELGAYKAVITFDTVLSTEEAYTFRMNDLLKLFHIVWRWDETEKRTSMFDILVREVGGEVYREECFRKSKEEMEGRHMINIEESQHGSSSCILSHGAERKVIDWDQVAVLMTVEHRNEEQDKDRMCRPSVGLPNRVGSDPVPSLTRQDHMLLNQAALETALPRVGHEHHGTRHEGKLGSGHAGAEVTGTSGEPTRQGKRQGTADLEHECLNEAGCEARIRVEEDSGQRCETAEGTPEAAADGLQEGLTTESEQELLRKETNLRTEPRHHQQTSANLDASERMRIAGARGQGKVVGMTNNCNKPETDRQLRSKSGLGLEEEEIVLDGFTQNGNRQEEEKENSAESGSEMGDCLNDGTKPDREEQRPSWEEEMAENKEA